MLPRWLSLFSAPSAVANCKHYCETGHSSGSPVFLYNPGMWYSKTGTTTLGTRLKFVGVVAAVFFRNDINEIVTVPIPTQNERAVAVSREMIDLGVVFKARTVVETIELLARNRGANA